MDMDSNYSNPYKFINTNNYSKTIIKLLEFMREINNNNLLYRILTFNTIL